MRRRSAIVGLTIIGLIGFVPALPAHASGTITPTLIQTIDLSKYPTPLPDPMGITYDSTAKRLIVTDSEVEEVVNGNAPAFWHGANVFEIKTNGTLMRTVNLATKLANGTLNSQGWTDEPADVAYNPADGGHIYVTDDQKSQIWDVLLGDGKLDATDTKTTFKTIDMTEDPEGIGYALIGGEPNLFISAGEGPEPNWNGAKIHEIFRLRPGPNGVFDGPQGPSNPSGDDIMTHFDTCKPTDGSPIDPMNSATWCTNAMNQPDPEDVAYDESTGHLFLVSRNSNTNGGHMFMSEVDLDGALVNQYDLGNLNGVRPSGIVIAPTSNAAAISAYVTDRAIDNNTQRLANDGKIYEWRLTTPTNTGPTVTNPGAQTSNEGDVVSLPVAATDPDNDAFTYSATGLPPGLSIDSATGVISGTVPSAASLTSPYSVRVFATDVNTYEGSQTFTWTIKDATAPAAPALVEHLKQTTGVYLNWPDSPEVDLAGYNVYRSAAADGTFAKLNGPLLTTSEFFDSTAPAATASYYKVTAVDKASTPNESAPTLDTVLRSKITFVSTSQGKGSGMTMSIKRPADVVSGDVMLAAFSVRGSSTIQPPVGWTLVSQVSRTSLMSHQAIFSHTVANPIANEKASYLFSFVGRSSAVGMIVAYRGAVEGAQRTGGQANPASTSITAPGTTPTTANSLQIAFFSSGVETTITPPDGMVERCEYLMNSGRLRMTMEASDVIVDAAPVASRVAIATESAENIGQVVVLNPAP